MKISSTTFYTSLFIFIAICQLYVESFRVNIFLQLGALAGCIFLEPLRFSKKILQHVGTLMLLLLIGFAGTLIHRYSMTDVFKDLFHFIKPVVGLLLGYILFKRIGDFRMFARALVIAAIASATIHLCIILFLTDFTSGAIEKIRYYTKDNFLELFAIFLLIYFPKFEGSEIFEKSWQRKVWMIVLTLSAFLYFSRTMFIIAGIIWLTIKGYTKITKRGLQVFGILLILTGLLYSYLYNANIKRNAKGLENFLYKIKIAPAEIVTFNIDRQNHADLWDHWRGYEAKRALALMAENPSSFVFGTGHGSLVDLKFFAPLTGDNKGIRYISELHNGYVFVLYKTGFIGLLVYLFVLLRWYAYIYKRRNLKNILISAGGFIFLLTSVMVTGIYNNKDIIIFIIGAALYYRHTESTDAVGTDVASLKE